MLHVKSFTFNPVQENTYILYNEIGECIVVDPGCYFDHEKDELANYIRESKLMPKLLLNTHCHLDHVFGNKFVAETFGLKLHIHEKEKTMLEMAPASGLMYDLPFDNYNGELIYLKVGETIKLGNEKVNVKFTPGHSPGSVSFYSGDNGFVLSGDALFYRSIGRTDLPGGNTELLLKSIREELFTLPGETLVYSGHGPVTTIGEELLANPFLS